MDNTHQYISIDSWMLVNNNNFILDFMQPSPSSNIVLREIDSVIGLKIIDFYVSNATTSTLTSTNIQYIDVLCPSVPTTWQIKDQRNGVIFDRIFLERDEHTIYSKTYKPYYRKDTLFNPIPLSKMQFKLYDMKPTNTYEPLDPNVAFSMTLEVVTLNPKHIEDELTTSIKALNNSISKIKFIPQYLYSNRTY